MTKISLQLTRCVAQWVFLEENKRSSVVAARSWPAEPRRKEDAGVVLDDAVAAPW